MTGKTVVESVSVPPGSYRDENETDKETATVASDSAPVSTAEGTSSFSSSRISGRNSLHSSPSPNLTAEVPLVFSAVALSLHLARDPSWFLLKAVVPLLAVLAFGFLSYAVEFTDLGTRLSILITAFLTSFAIQWVSTDRLPRVPFETKLDRMVTGVSASLFGMALGCCGVYVAGRASGISAGRGDSGAEESKTFLVCFWMDKGIAALFFLGFGAYEARHWGLFGKLAESIRRAFVELARSRRADGPARRRAPASSPQQHKRSWGQGGQWWNSSAKIRLLQNKLWFFPLGARGGRAGVAGRGAVSRPRHGVGIPRSVEEF